MKRSYFIFICMVIFICMYIYLLIMCVPGTHSPEESVRSPGTRLTEGCGLTCGWMLKIEPGSSVLHHRTIPLAPSFSSPHFFVSVQNPQSMGEWCPHSWCVFPSQLTFSVNTFTDMWRCVSHVIPVPEKSTVKTGHDLTTGLILLAVSLWQDRTLH